MDKKKSKKEKTYQFAQPTLDKDVEAVTIVEMWNKLEGTHKFSFNGGEFIEAVSIQEAANKYTELLKIRQQSNQ
jgi:hypothetical protein